MKRSEQRTYGSYAASAVSVASVASVVSVAVAALAALALLSPIPVQAQRAHPVIAPDSLRRIQEVEPMHGPPGTRVTVYTGNLPPQAAVHLGVGSVGSGFEALATARQGMWGEVEGALTIPETAPWDRAVRIIAFNAIFAPIGLSDPFHVPRPDGLLRRTGTVTDEGVECLAFRDSDGHLYTLVGEIEGLAPRTNAVVEGRYVEASRCTQGSTIAVTRVVGAGEPGR